ncbi:MAG: peptidoglycan bridge formation glycyltransferase FemA/FemB family protein [Erysipelotrichaceae bacterium]|nr:peptidoglycan bridge formation glycyltransferase FemA/FemB family protein [Erysipelotrichaceae bacterium]
MEFVKGLTPDEFDTFNRQCQYDHYQKSTNFGELKNIEGFKYCLVGVKKDHQLVATALLLYKHVVYLNKGFCYVPYGYNIDYHDEKLLSFFNDSLRKFIQKEYRAFFLRIDPNVSILQHDKDGKVTTDGYDHRYISDHLIKDGFMHLGYNYGYSGNWLSRYTYVLDLKPDLDVILKGIKNYNNHNKKNELRDIRVTKGTRSDLVHLYQAQLVLAKKEKFIPKSLSYFTAFYDNFEDMVTLYIAHANLEKAYQNLLDEKQELESQIVSLTNVQRKKQAQVQIDALDKELNEMVTNGYHLMKDTILGAKLIIQCGSKVFNVFMYTHKILPNFRVALALHKQAIIDSKLKNALSYDFEGVSGSLDPKDPYYGIYDFKKSFGGDFIEYPGEFDMIFDDKRYRSFRKIDRIYRRYRRRLFLLFKGW